MALNRRAGCAKTGVVLRKTPVFVLKVPRIFFRADARKLNHFLGLAQISKKRRKSRSAQGLGWCIETRVWIPVFVLWTRR